MTSTAVLSDPRERDVRAAVAVSGVLSHATAARWWGIELVEDEPEAPVHLTVARCRSRCARTGTVVHRADLGLDDLALLGGVVLTSVPRTLLDLARTLPVCHGVVAADSALRHGLVTVEDLWDAAGRLPPGLGTPRAMDVVARVDPCSASALESLCRLLLEDAGLRPFETQHVVSAGGMVVGRVDFAWPDHRVAVETDGFAFHSDRTRYRSDRRRGNALALAGWTVLRFSWEDVVSRPEVVVGQVRLALGR